MANSVIEFNRIGALCVVMHTEKGLWPSNCQFPNQTSKKTEKWFPLAMKKHIHTHTHTVYYRGNFLKLIEHMERNSQIFDQTLLEQTLKTNSLTN